MNLSENLGFIIRLSIIIIGLLFFFVGAPEGGGIIVSYILLGLALGAAVVLPIMFTDKKSMMYGLIGVGAVAICFLLGWVFASGELNEVMLQKYSVTSSSVKLVEGGIIASYIMLGIACLGFVYGFIREFVR